jgi:hypothetical protein
MLDTDTASYIIKGRSPSVAEKLAAIPPSDICVSAVTRAELAYGLKRLPPEHRLHLGVASSSASSGRWHGIRTRPTTMQTSGTDWSRPASRSASST